MLKELYRGVYKALADDDITLTYLGIDKALPPDELSLAKAKSIRKRSKPPEVDTTLPIINYYAPPGQFDEGNAVYITNVIFDIYTQDDVELALDIASRIQELFHKKIPVFEGLTTWEAYMVTEHESITDKDNVYLCTLVMCFSINNEKE